MDGKEYKIIIKGEGEEKGEKTVEKTLDNDKPKNVSIKGLVSAGFILNAIRTAVDYSINSIEMYTGNSVAQRQIQEIRSLPRTMLGFVANPTEMFLNIARASNANMWETRRAEQMARRSGNYLSTTTR